MGFKVAKGEVVTFEQLERRYSLSCQISILFVMFKSSHCFATMNKFTMLRPQFVMCIHELAMEVEENLMAPTISKVLAVRT